MMYCNNTIQCHDSRQKDNTMVQIVSLKKEMFETGLKQKNLKFILKTPLRGGGEIKEFIYFMLD